MYFQLDHEAERRWVRILIQLEQLRIAIQSRPEPVASAPHSK